MFRLIYEHDGKQELEHYPAPVDIEYRYFELSRMRHDGPSAIKISVRQLPISPAYYRLDRDWTGEREQAIERRHLWTVRAQDYQSPTVDQIRAVGKMIGVGRIIGSLAGWTDREWRYITSGEHKLQFARWRVLLELAGLAGALPTAQEILGGRYE